MKVTVPEISWHERDPVYTVDFQPGKQSIQRLASGGVDKIVRIWQMNPNVEGTGQFEILSNLRRHTAAVNVVRFSPNGELLSTAGDDSSIVVWKLSDVPTQANIFSEEGSEDDKETWVCYKTLRGHLGDVADLSWSKDSRYLVSGSVDNSAIVWDVVKAQKFAFFNDHKSYVQGVAFDPLGDYIATLCSDRSLRIFSLSSKNCLHNVSKMMPISSENQSTAQETKPKAFKIFHDDSLLSFFRRLEWTTDGQLLLTPAGCVEVGEKTVNSSFVFVRGAFARPALYLPSGKSTTVVRANPQLFELKRPDTYDEQGPEKEWEKCKSLFSLPYRIVYAVGTEDSILLYDTQQTLPIGLMKNVHYSRINDLSWTSDGRILIASSTDGFCTIVSFDKNELGTVYVEKKEKEMASDSSSQEIKKNEAKPLSPSTQKVKDKQEPNDRKDKETSNTNVVNKNSQNKPDSKEKDKSTVENNVKVETDSIQRLKIEDAKTEEKEGNAVNKNEDEKMEVDEADSDKTKIKEAKVEEDMEGKDKQLKTPEAKVLTGSSKSPGTADGGSQKKKRIQFTTLSLKKS